MNSTAIFAYQRHMGAQRAIAAGSGGAAGTGGCAKWYKARNLVCGVQGSVLHPGYALVDARSDETTLEAWDEHLRVHGKNWTGTAAESASAAAAFVSRRRSAGAR